MSYLENGYNCEVWAFKNHLYVKLMWKSGMNKRKAEEDMFARFGVTRNDMRYISSSSFTMTDACGRLETFVASW